MTNISSIFPFTNEMYQLHLQFRCILFHATPRLTLSPVMAYRRWISSGSAPHLCSFCSSLVLSTSVHAPRPRLPANKIIPRRVIYAGRLYTALEALMHAKLTLLSCFPREKMSPWRKCNCRVDVSLVGNTCGTLSSSDSRLECIGHRQKESTIAKRSSNSRMLKEQRRLMDDRIHVLWSHVVLGWGIRFHSARVVQQTGYPCCGSVYHSNWSKRPTRLYRFATSYFQRFQWYLWL